MSASMSYREEALRIIEEADGDLSSAAKTTYGKSRGLVLYVIELGLGTLKAKHRRTRRRELRATVQPQFMKKPGGVTGSVVLTPAAKKRLMQGARDLFGSDGWQIGELNLGSMTKEQLMAQAMNERASAKGSLRNASFYEALADPLKPGQMAHEYWKPADAHRIKREVWKDTEGSRATLT
jgi:hypothetical protein